MDRWLLVLCDYKQIFRCATCLIAFAADRLAFDTRNLNEKERKRKREGCGSTYTR
jgi:hypothetical protein